MFGLRNHVLGTNQIGKTPIMPVMLNSNQDGFSVTDNGAFQANNAAYGSYNMFNPAPPSGHGYHSTFLYNVDKKVFITLPVAKKIVRIKGTNIYGQHHCQFFTLYGSSDNINFNPLFANPTALNPSDVWDFTFANTVSYRYYYLLFSSNGSYIVFGGNWQLFN